MLNPVSKSKNSNLNERTFKFSLKLISLVSNFPKKDNRYWILSDQLVRSGTSVGANIREAKGSSSRKEFCRYYEIALKSANETEYWLSLLYDSGLSKNEETKQTIEEINQLTRMIAASLLTLKGKR